MCVYAGRCVYMLDTSRCGRYVHMLVGVWTSVCVYICWYVCVDTGMCVYVLIGVCICWYLCVFARY